MQLILDSSEECCMLRCTTAIAGAFNVSYGTLCVYLIKENLEHKGFFFRFLTGTKRGSVTRITRITPCFYSLHLDFYECIPDCLEDGQLVNILSSSVLGFGFMPAHMFTVP